MAEWLCIEEAPLDDDLLVAAAPRAGRSKKSYLVTLRGVRVLDNKKLFGGADVGIHTVVIDGYPDMKSENPFWAQTLQFPNVKDGNLLSIDPDLGFQLYRGKPQEFLNLYVMAVRNKNAARDFAKVLKDNMVGEGIGTLAGAAVSIYATVPAGFGPDAIRKLTTTAVNTTIDYFAKQKNPAIGVYYGSLLRENGFGLGPHPAGLPDDLIACGEGLQLGYDVTDSAH